MGDATQFHCPHHDRPYYSHMIQTNEARSSYCCWLVTAATRDDMITFFKGFIKYSKTNNGANITDLKPVHLAWWTFNCPGDDHVWKFLEQIYQSNMPWYRGVEELKQSRGKITMTQLRGNGGSWLVLPCQDVSLGGHFDLVE